MKLHSRSFMGFIVLVAILVSGCGLNHHADFYISNPADHSVLPLGTTITVRLASNASPDSNINRYQVQVFDNGGMVIDRVYQSFPGSSVSIPFPQPATPGGHILYANARAVYVNGTMTDWYRTLQTCVFVGTPTSSTFCQPYAQNGQPLSVAPTITPTPNRMIANVQAYPSQAYYGPSCPSSLSTITFRAALILPGGSTPDQFQVNVQIGVRVGSSGANSGSLLVPLLSNGTWDATSGGAVYIGTLSLTHSYNDANNQLDLASLGTSSGAILWYATVSGNNSSGQNTELVRSPNQVLSLSPCPASGGVLPHNPNKGNGSATGCGQYTNQTSCDLAGCSWNPQASSCTVTP